MDLLFKIANFQLPIRNMRFSKETPNKSDFRISTPNPRSSILNNNTFNLGFIVKFPKNIPRALILSPVEQVAADANTNPCIHRFEFLAI